jgi:regulator of RNase E activity RraA
VLDPPRASAEMAERFRGSASASVADSQGRFRFMDFGIRARTGLPLCGIAITVNARPADNLMVHKALELARPGDVLVVSTNGNTTSAVFGELMGRAALAAQLGGLVVDGAVRDVDALTELGLPVFSRTVCGGGCDKDGPGEINVPVSCGGTVVHPGDIVVGDSDGVTVVPREDAEEVHRRLVALCAGEVKRMQEIDRGELFKPAINETLKARGVLGP